MGKKIGVALCGGGVRSVAQIGALMALEELGYEIVEIAGASGGAIIAGLYSRGYSPIQLTKIAAKMNWLSLLTLEKRMRTLYGIRKEAIPCRVVYTLMNGDTVVDDSHPKAIARSCNIPGFPAVKGKFMDGCIKHNYPVSTLKSTQKICFNVISGIFPSKEYNYCKQLSYVNDMYVIQQKPKDDVNVTVNVTVIDLVDYYVNPLACNFLIYKKLINSGYAKTMEALK